MIIREQFKIKDYDMTRTYSDLSVYIRKIKLGGNEELYSIAEDPAELSSVRIYEETNISIDFNAVNNEKDLENYEN